MLHGKEYINEDVIYMCKSHFCPDCKTKLKKVKVSKVINTASPNNEDMKELATRLHVKNIQTEYVGNVKYVWKEFECPNCKRHITVSEMKEIEGYDNSVGTVGIIIFIICCILFLALLFFAVQWFK